MLFENAIKAKYKSVLFSRVDAKRDTYYFSPEDFPGLHFEPYEFLSREGAILRGGFYFYDNPKAKELVIFVHGVGSGHRSYMREIELIARGGFKVFSYDQTGCMASGGASALGFAHALSDLDACISSLTEKEELRDTELSLVGHSQGGYAVMNIPKYHRNIKSIVSISGPLSIDTFLEDTFPGILSLYRKAVFSLEEGASGAYINADARNGLTATDANILIIHSKDDGTVSFKNNFIRLKEALGGRENIKFMQVSGKGHNPNYTKGAVALLGKFFTAVKSHRKTLHTDDENEKFKSSFDWYKMTEQDKEVFDEIMKTLNRD